MKTIRQRFNEKWIEAPSGCWEWQGAKSGDKYGKFSFKSKTQYAHRLSWAFHNNREIPEGMFICHTCDNPGCVNPAHLVCRDNSWNLADMVAKGRSLKGRSNNVGEAHGGSKLTASDVKGIRALLAEGLSERRIGKIYGVTHGNVHKIKTGRLWSHV